jgi:hypothetical protein
MKRTLGRQLGVSQVPPPGGSSRARARKAFPVPSPTVNYSLMPGA